MEIRSISKNEGAVEGDDADRFLQPDESIAFAFICTKYEGFVGNSIGYPVLKWCNSMGEFSILRGDDSLSKAAAVSNPNNPSSGSPSSSPLRFARLAAPSEVYVGDDFTVIVRVHNKAFSDIPITLSCSHKSMEQKDESDYTSMRDAGLIFTGLTHTNIGLLATGDFADVTISLYANIPGLFDIPTVYIMHSVTKESYPITNLGRVLVYDSEYSDDNITE